MKKKDYIVQLTRYNVTFDVHLTYKFSEGAWSFYYEELLLGSSYGKLVKFRDSLFKSLERNLQNIFEFEAVEKFNSIAHLPPRSLGMEHYSNDEIWFINRKSRSCPVNYTPEWVFPTSIGSTSIASIGNYLNCYITIKRLMRTTKYKKAIKVNNLSDKFGL